jgi:hypothetical protein
MVMSVEYPCLRSGEPAKLSAGAIRQIAEGFRERLFGPVVRPIQLESLVRKTTALRVNGRSVRIAWGLNYGVHDDQGIAVLGVCEHDPQEPGTVMISVNGELLWDDPELMRSTAAHELGHAIFDMPAAMAKGAARAFRSSRQGNASQVSDWREWRADEFMGAFLAPKRQLARAFAREAAAHGIAFRWRQDRGVPTPFIRAEETSAGAVDAMIGTLAAQFGLSDSFVGVRLQKYGLVR